MTVPAFLQAEVDRLIKDAVDSAEAAKDRAIAALTSSKDADIATLTASIHEKEIAIVTAKANLTVCSSKLEARRLVRLANVAEDLAALVNDKATVQTDPCAGQTDPSECDLWSAQQCGSVLFGNVDVTEVCPVLCDSCSPEETTNGADNSPDTSATATGSNTLFLAVGICAGIVVLATIVNVLIRRNAASEGGNQHSIDAVAFVNPMYSEKAANGGGGAAQEGTYEEMNTAAAEEDTYDDVVGGGADDTYENTVDGDDGNYLNVANEDLRC